VSLIAQPIFFLFVPEGPHRKNSHEPPPPGRTDRTPVMVYYAGLVLKASFPRSGKIEEKTGFMAKKQRFLRAV
jgi:hypothetical protein